MKNLISVRTHIFDLDWNRHVTSRTYERFSQESRHSILSENGFSTKKCIEEGLVLIPEFTKIQFMAQQFSGAMLTVKTEATPFTEGKILWDHKIFGEDGKLACEIKLVTRSQDQSGNAFSFLESKETMPSNLTVSLNSFTNSCKRLTNDYLMLHCELNCFWIYPPDAIWKVFEEGRWLFFMDIIDLSKITALNTTSFFMGGKIQFFRLPKSGEKLKIFTWIESVEKIRFYIRQDLVSHNGDLIASMRDEQLFVSISASRPRKAPDGFLEIVKEYVEYLK